MSWTTAGVQSGTDASLSGLTSVSGTSTTTVGNVTVYTVTSQLTINGNLTMDPLTEQLVQTYVGNNSISIGSAGSFTIGAEITSGSGNGLLPIRPIQTAIIFAEPGGGTNNGPFTINGDLYVYGAAFNLNGTIDVNSGCTVTIRDGIFYSHNDDGNNRWRSNADPADYDVDGLITYGYQFDSLVDGTFGKLENYLALDKGIPIENATGTTGAVRAWRSMPDNTYAADALMNNWQGAKDVQIYLAENGSRMLIAPDSCDGTGGINDAAHGGRLYHEFTVSAFDVLNAPIEDVVCYIADYDNGDRATTTTTGGSISQGDQVLTPSTGVSGATALQTLLTAMYYRLDNVGDISTTNGLERVDNRAKPHAVLCSISGSSGVAGTFGSSDSSLPNLLEGDRFILNGSTSNDSQVWETTEDWTGGNGGDANRLSTNSTNEAENTMDMIVLGEDRYDAYLWGYGYLPYKFTDAVMKGLTQLDLVATLLTDPAITQTDASTVDSYTTIDDLNEFYDSQKNYKTTPANVDEPTIDTPLVLANGNELDLGGLNLVVNTGAGSAFAFSTDTITIKPTTELDKTSTKVKIKTTGDITFTTASIGDGMQLEGDVYLNAAQDLTDVLITGDLYIDTSANSILTFSNVTVTGNVYNDATGNTLTINLEDSSSVTAGDAGTGNGQTNAVNTVPIKVTVKDAATLALIQGARVYIKTEAGGPSATDVVLVNELTDVAGEVNSTVEYEGDQPISGTVRKGTP